jgi:hypothetical protein
MIFGKKTDKSADTTLSKLMACVLVAFLPPFAFAGSSTDLELDELMRTLAEVDEAGGKFTERKYLSILSEPLILEGRVRYKAPDYVKKVYDDPDSESYEVSGEHLTIEASDGRRRDMSIDEHPVLRAFVESYRATLAGDRETLKRYFDLELSGNIDEWQLRLTPRQRELADYLSAVIMHGRKSTVYRVETQEAGGDRSVMTLDVPGE